MPVAHIRIFEKDDGKQFDDLPGTKRKIVCSDLPWQIGLIQNGMESGKHSVMLNVLLPDGTLVVLEQSLTNWDMITGAFRGAQERWQMNSP